MVEKKQYSDEFEREALRLQEMSCKRVAQVERELGLSHVLLRQWINCSRHRPAKS